jgi:hypothetical protein
MPFPDFIPGDAPGAPSAALLASRQQILREIGEPPNSALYALFVPLEAAYAGEAALDPRLLPLRVKLALLEGLLGTAAREVDHAEGDEKESSSQRFKQLLALKQGALAEVDLIYGAMGGGSVLIGSMAEPTGVTGLYQP